jgi:zinc transporter ZupT
VNAILIDSFLLLLAVVLGGLFVIFLEKNNQKKLIKLSLAFSGGFLLAIAFTHFLPELYRENTVSIGIWILVGFLVQLFLEYFSGGIEHGHIHVHATKKIPYGLLISLSIHSFIEGMPLMALNDSSNSAIHASNHHQESLLIGIILHQLPVAIALMTLLRQSLLSAQKSWFLLLFFGMMTPAGMLTGYLLEMTTPFQYMDLLLAIVVGMFLHISTTIIFETSENHHFNLAKLSAILLGVALSFGLI